jgi:hypothetical protein
METDAIDPEAAQPSAPAVPDPHAPIPRQMRYIIANEEDQKGAVLESRQFGWTP